MSYFNTDNTQLLIQHSVNGDVTLLKQKLDDVRVKKIITEIEIEEKISAVKQLLFELSIIRQAISEELDRTKKELEENIKLESTNLVDLEHYLDKKQSGVFPKLFSNKETIENIRGKINEKSNLLILLKHQLDKLITVKLTDSNLIFSNEFQDYFPNSKLLTQKRTLENLQKTINETNQSVDNLQQQLKICKIKIECFNDDLKLEEQYAKVATAFHQLKESDKIYNITSETSNNDIKASAKSTINREEIKFKVKDYSFIQSTEPAFFLKSAKGNEIYIYPTFILIKDKNEQMNVINLKDLKLQFAKQRIIERPLDLPKDAKIIDHVWFKVNKDGSPDMRYKGNYQSPVIIYGVLNFTYGAYLNEVYHISCLEAVENFSNELRTYLSLLNNEELIQSNLIISVKYFETLKELAKKFVHFLKRLNNNSSFKLFLNEVPDVKEISIKTIDEKINFIFVVDILQCYNLISNLFDLRSKESFAIRYLLYINSGYQLDDIDNVGILFNDLAVYENFFNSFKNYINKDVENSELFKLSNILSSFDKNLQEEYLSMLYLFASIVAKADDKVTQEEEIALKRILNTSEVKKVSQQKQITKITVTEQQSLNEILNELNSLIGLEAVKGEIKTLVNFIKIQKAREATGLKSSTISYHIVFTGNPGTGKTTVARIISKIYKALGVLTQGQLVETDRSGLIAEYVGQTAIKVNKLIDTAINGVLFIDEAYSIAEGGQNDFGKEAIATLIKRMEDSRDKLIVILAGYINEMRHFIDTNPGFKSRFNRYIEFADYTPSEMLSIYESQCSKLDYTLTNEAKAALSNLIESAYSSRDKSFGNGRFVRNIFEKTLEKQANRIASIASLNKETLTTITVEDIPGIYNAKEISIFE